MELYINIVLYKYLYYNICNICENNIMIDRYILILYGNNYG